MDLHFQAACHPAFYRWTLILYIVVAAVVRCAYAVQKQPILQV